MEAISEVSSVFGGAAINEGVRGAGEEREEGRKRRADKGDVKRGEGQARKEREKIS